MGKAEVDEDEEDENNVEMSSSTKDFENIYKLVKILENDGQPESM
jgi:hypothetical protein